MVFGGGGGLLFHFALFGLFVVVVIVVVVVVVVVRLVFVCFDFHIFILFLCKPSVCIATVTIPDCTPCSSGFLFTMFSLAYLFTCLFPGHQYDWGES